MFSKSCRTARVPFLTFPADFASIYTMSSKKTTAFNDACSSSYASLGACHARPEGEATAAPSYEIIIVGGGHAGVEAALAGARMGCHTLLLTHSWDSIAQLPCNPSIGGLAKSHLVYELDALGGEMARTTDLTGIQFKTLNATRGPAVQATRAQCDKKAYAKQMQKVLKATPGLTVVQGAVTRLLTNANKIQGVQLADGTKYLAPAVIITTGTSLNGRIYVGLEARAG
ncbi:MAG: FAD-dependent oxidoreductase, partial [Desulfuromonadaceae bacterium]|nr:FAD-dependent oxidoreductase [Desulfuromonadaceae bacterium]